MEPKPGFPLQGLVRAPPGGATGQRSETCRCPAPPRPRWRERNVPSTPRAQVEGQILSSHPYCDSGVLGLAYGLMAKILVAEPELGPGVRSHVGPPIT